MEYIHYRDLVGVAYTEEEAKAMAAEIEVRGGCGLREGGKGAIYSCWGWGTAWLWKAGVQAQGRRARQGAELLCDRVHMGCLLLVLAGGNVRHL